MDGRQLTPLPHLISGRRTREVVFKYLKILFFYKNRFIIIPIHSGDQKSRGPLAVEAFRRGPSSVESVRRGEVGFAFDTPYVRFKLKSLPYKKLAIKQHETSSAVCRSQR